MEAKTVIDAVNEFKGVIFQVGKFYMHHGACDEWFISKLEGINPNSDHPFSFGVVRSDNCLEINQEYIGIATEAPIELIDGKAYQFDYNGRTELVGIYHKPDDTFGQYTVTSSAKAATNIKLLEVKS